MANRLTKIYTRTGDDGSTGLGDGARTPKESARIEAIGAVDELNSCIGVLLAETLEENMRGMLEDIQHNLFDLGGDLSIPGRIIQHNLFDLGGDLSIPDRASMSQAQITRLELQLDEYNATLPALKEFILPGGARAAALCHVARAVCRRAERCAVRLSRTEAVAPASIQYLNRLSDFLFVLCRVLNRQQGVGDVLWQPGRNR